MTDLKIFANHPVQYHAPLFRELAATMDLEVGYYHQGAASQIAHDTEFGIDYEWDVDLLSGYRHRIFLSKTASFSRAEQLTVMAPILSWALRDRTTPLLLMGWSAEIAWLAWLLRLASKAPTLVLSETTPLSFGSAPKGKWRIAALRWLLTHSAAATYIGTQNRSFLLAMGVASERLFSAPYSIDNTRFSDEAERLSMRREELCLEHGLDPGLPVFLFCGKLIPKKRPLELLDAYLAAGLKDKAQLLYVGDGVLRSAIESRARDAGAKRVRVLGFLNQSEMPLAYVLGETLCLISESTETWGLVVNEAMACKRPVIVSETCGCCADLVGPESGWKVKLDDHKSLVDTLLAALARRADWATMGRAGARRLAAHTFRNMAAGLSAAVAYTRSVSVRGIDAHSHQIGKI